MRLIFLLFVAILKNSDAAGKKGDFDFLIFVQDWPISDCIDWLSQNESRTGCSIKGKHLANGLA